MAKYLSHNAGVLQEVQPVNTSAGAADAAKIPELDASGRLDATMMPVGVGPDTAAINASENLAAGAMVNVFDNGGSVGVRNADSTTAGKETNGFVLAAVTASNPAQVFFEGIVTGLSGLTPGALYYTSTTAGGVTTTVPSASGNVVQSVGRALSATELSFEPSALPVELV